MKLVQVGETAISLKRRLECWKRREFHLGAALKGESVHLNGIQ